MWEENEDESGLEWGSSELTISIPLTSVRLGCRSQLSYLSKTAIEQGCASENVDGCICINTCPQVVETHAEGRQGETTETERSRVGQRGGRLKNGVQR